VAPTVTAALPEQAAQSAAATPSATNMSLNGLSGWSVPSDWGSAWRPKLAAAKAGTGLAVAALVGDSIGYGYWASNLNSTSWPELLRTSLIAVGGNGGSGFQGQVHSPSVMYNPNSGVPDYYKTVPSNIWTQTGTWSPLATPWVYGPGTGSLMANSNGAQLSSTFVGSKLGIWYYDSGGAFTVKIDGTTVGTITPGVTNLVKHVGFAAPGGAVTSHSWSIAATVVSGTGIGSVICGVEGLADKGVRFDNFSFPGLYAGFVNNSDSPYLSGTFFGGWQNPADLLIYELGINDMGGADPAYPNGTPPDIWAANVQSYLNGVMNTTYGGDARGQTDLLLLFPITNLTGDKHALYNQYKARAVGIADINAMFRTSWNAWQKAGYAGNQADPTKSGNDYNHPSDAGHAFVANQLKPLITALA
jgi:lysophospholipase L1-like esterase